MKERKKRFIPEMTIDTAVIGAGIVGLAIARKLTLEGRDVFVFEAEKTMGEHTSSRNSEVIHSGIYYQSDSLKAKLCVEGKQKLYEYCEQKQIKHKKVGKLIVATSAKEENKLEEIYERGVMNGLNDLIPLDRREVRIAEFMVRGISGLYSPSTGIVDSHGLMDSLRRDAEEEGASFIFSTPVLEGEVQNDGIVLSLGSREPAVIKSNLVVNTAGLKATEVAKKISGVPEDSIPESFYSKGHYFILNKPSPFSHLVYPIPEEGGLGVHVTLDLEGRARFGPDVSPVDSIDYTFDESRAERFYEAIRTYYPRLKNGDLSPGYTGIRPKLRSSSEQDFVIQGPKEHGVPGLVNLFGIESPGLTSSLAIADHVVKQI